MQQTYLLEWYDLLVCVTLNPAKNNLLAIKTSDVESIFKMANEEKEKIQLNLNRQVYTLRDPSEIELLIRRYHANLIILLDQISENNTLVPVSAIEVKELSKTVTKHLDELLSFIEGRYLKFLGLDEWIPTSYLVMTRQELKVKLGELKGKITRRIDDKKLVSIVFDTLYRFVNDDGARRVTYREVVYKKELVKGLEELTLLKSEKSLYGALNELLIYINFNKKAYLNYYTAKIADRINAYVSGTDKLDQLLLAFKEFKQMHLKPGVRLNPNYKGIKSVIGNWFEEEINYLERKYHWQVSPLENRQLPHMEKSPAVKIRVALNSDQIGVLLMAFAAVGVLDGGSIQSVFRSVIPLLSSAEKENLSWDSVRKRSYAPEERDQKAVIALLEKTIAAIKKIA